MKNKHRITSTSYVFLSASFLLCSNANTNSTAQPQQNASVTIIDYNQPKISDHIFTTLRKDNALYDLQLNITLPAGKDMI